MAVLRQEFLDALTAKFRQVYDNAFFEAMIPRCGVCGRSRSARVLYTPLSLCHRCLVRRLVRVRRGATTTVRLLTQAEREALDQLDLPGWMRKAIGRSWMRTPAEMQLSEFLNVAAAACGDPLPEQALKRLTESARARVLADSLRIAIQQQYEIAFSYSADAGTVSLDEPRKV